MGIHCICCDKELSPVDKEAAPHQPRGGIMCSSFGNFGSTVFDSIDHSEELLFLLCDDCLKKQAHRTFVYVNGQSDPIRGEEYFNGLESDGAQS